MFYCRRANQRRTRPFSDVTRPRRSDIFLVTDVTKRWLPGVPDVTSEVLSPVRRIQKNLNFLRQINLKHTKIVPERAFVDCLWMKQQSETTCKQLTKKKTHIAQKNDIAFFASEKHKNYFQNLSQKIYMKVNLLVEFNTSVGPQINFSLVEFFK